MRSTFSEAGMLAGLSLTLSLTLPAQATRGPDEPLDAHAIEFLRTQGLEHSEVMEHLSWLCDVHGPRLTGSPNLRRAQHWAVKTLTEWGFERARREPWGPFGRGWQLDHVAVHVTGENPWPVLAWPKAWSPGIPATTADVVLVADMDADSLRALDLTGKIVLLDTARATSEPYEGAAERLDSEDLLTLVNGAPPPRAASPEPSREARAQRDLMSGFRRRGEIMRLLDDKRPLAIIDRGQKGDYGTVFVQGASPISVDGERGRAWAAGAQVVPQFTIAVEHYNRMLRLLQKNVPVRLAVDLRTTFFDDDVMEANVIAELPGTDPQLQDQIVMFGAHLDSWHSATGTTDNGCGSAVMLEAARLLAKLVAERGEGPRRTVRIALWSGEEQGLLGSRAYVAQQFAAGGGRNSPPTELKPAHALLSGYFNLDNGTGRIRGVYQQGNEAVAPIFRAWLRPFHDLGAATLAPGDTGGTDHLAFDAVGLPGFQFIQDPAAYSTRTHHSNMDAWDHALADDLQQAATIIASFVWHTAQRDAMLPREPLPTPVQAAPASGRPAASASGAPAREATGDSSAGR